MANIPPLQQNFINPQEQRGMSQQRINVPRSDVEVNTVSPNKPNLFQKDINIRNAADQAKQIQTPRRVVASPNNELLNRKIGPSRNNAMDNGSRLLQRQMYSPQDAVAVHNTNNGDNTINTVQGQLFGLNPRINKPNTPNSLNLNPGVNPNIKSPRFSL